MEAEEKRKFEEHRFKMDKFLGDSVNPGRVIKKALYDQLIEKDDLATK